ncbi:unnamed protein product [Chrysoparadoxa australica]
MRGEMPAGRAITAKRRAHATLMSLDKAALKAKCLERVRQEREKYVQRLRQGSAPPVLCAEQILTAGIISQRCDQKAMQEEQDMVIWGTDELEQSDSEDSMAMEAPEVDEEEWQEMMRYVQDLLDEETKVEQDTALGNEYERLLRAEEAALERQVEQLECDAAAGDSEQVLCPVCKSHNLLDTSTALRCACGLRLGKVRIDWSGHADAIRPRLTWPYLLGR